MKLLVLTALLTVAAAAGRGNMNGIVQFNGIVSCLIPDISPFKRFNNYGCYCGLGGYGTPVDELDRCCQRHDNCWDQAVKLGLCHYFWDKPHFEWYTYYCTATGIICSKKNSLCEDFLCKCDRTAAMCFATVPYNKKYKNLNRKKYCRKWASPVERILSASSSSLALQ